jgi:hypothetical protein
VAEFLRTVQAVKSYCQQTADRPDRSPAVARVEEAADGLLQRFRSLLDASASPLEWKRPICRLVHRLHGRSPSRVEVRHGLPILTILDERRASVTTGAFHAVASLVVQHLPGVAADLAEVTGWTGDTWLLAESDRVGGPIDAAAWCAWRSVLLTDAVAVHLGGAAAMERLVSALAHSEQPDEVLEAGHFHQFCTAHPPPHLRVHLMGWQLEAMGESVAAGAALRTWNKVHGFAVDAHRSPRLLVPRRVSMEAVPLAPVLQLGASVIQHALHAPLPSLRGHSLSAVLAPGARSQRLA